MKSIKALIIEDEKPARDLLLKYLEEHENISVEAECDNGFSGLKAINELKPDVVFLDVQMPKLTGFEMLELLDHKPEIIFTTAYDQYAIKAFEENAVDYLLKPFSRERFREAVARLTDRLGQGGEDHNQLDRIRKHLDASGEILHRVVIKKSGKIHVIPVDQVRYIEAQDDYVMIYTQDERFLKQQTMKYFEGHLDGEIFIRVHRSYIVNIQFIERLEPFEKSSFILHLTGGGNVPVSRTGMQLLKEKLNF